MKTTLGEFLLLGAGLLFLLFINAVLVACEAALVRLRYGSISAADIDAMRRRKRLAYLLDNASAAAPVIRFGIVAATVGQGGLLFPMLTIGLMKMPVFQTQPGKTVAAILSFFVAVTFIRLLGFLTPRGLALARPLQTLRWTSWIVIAFVAVVQPWFLSLRRLVSRFFKALDMPFELDMNVLDVEVQIRALAEDKAPPSSPYLRKLILNTLKIRELEVSDVLLPRNRVQCMDLNEPLEDNLAIARTSGHSRFPLCRGDLDHCVGIIHIKDLFAAGLPATEATSRTHAQSNAGSAAEGGSATADADATSPAVDLLAIKRSFVTFRTNTPLEEALQTLLSSKVHMALVRDDFGGTLGVLTLDTILEEIVGDIDDEFDIPEAADIVAIDENTFRVEGLAAVHDVEDALGIRIPSEAFSTFGGLVSGHLGRIPEKGETLELPQFGLRVVVEAVDERRLISAKVTRLAAPQTHPADKPDKAHAADKAI